MSTVMPSMHPVTQHPTRSATGRPLARQLALSLRGPWPFVPFSDAGEVPGEVAHVDPSVPGAPASDDAAQLTLPLVLPSPIARP